MRHTKKNKKYFYNYGIFKFNRVITNLIKIFLKIILLVIFGSIAMPFLPVVLIGVIIIRIVYHRKKSN